MLQLAGQRAPRAVRTGAVKLLIRAKGRAKAKLDRTGRVKVKAIVTFTPTGGSPRTQTKRVKLEKTILHRQKRTTR